MEKIQGKYSRNYGMKKFQREHIRPKEVITMKKPEEMTITELKEYVNSLTNEEFEEFERTFDVSQYDEDMDLALLLKGSRLYDYLRYKNGDDITVEL